ncbi:Ef-hand domain-containing family member c2, partial [Globisporangium splendens]
MSIGKANGLATAKDILTTKLSQIRGASAPQEPTFYDLSGTGNSSKNQDTRFRKSSNNAGATSTKYRVDTIQPKWITNDRQVLRFYGYFQENGYDTLRTRRVVLCFYLSDNTISISEPHIENSGMVQGEFMKRTCVTKPNGMSFTPDDFRIGKEVRLYGRIFHIVDSDEVTRAFYEEAMDAPLDSPRKYPDNYSSQVDEIETIKAKLCAKTTAIVESKAEAVRKFHENSQKVLRFYLSWQDPHPLYPETRKYILHYYLCDDTIEIVEPKKERERVGRDHFAVLLSRRKVMKQDKIQQATPVALLEHPKGRLLTDRDLRCGEYMSIFSRQFLLEDCDPFTRDYYLETHGVTQEPCEAAPIGTNSKPSKWKLLQQTVSRQSNEFKPTGGFGSAMLQRLDAHVQDNQEKSSKFHQSDALDSKQLRFRVCFHGLRKEDMNYHRKFTLTYFLEDDTLSVFEPRVKNSGVTGGRFLDRGRLRKCLDAANGGTMSRENQKERSAYCASDFYVGAIVRFEFSPNQRLELIVADEQT